MKKIIYFVLLVILFLHRIVAKAASIHDVTFGNVAVYQPIKPANAFVLFVSGDGGWNKGVVDMAKHIVDQGAMVAGVDIQQYFKNLRQQKLTSYYPAGDFEELSISLQKQYKIAKYLKPILIGYSSGATLVYGMLAQAPTNTFLGAISLGFGADIDIDKPLSNGSGLKSHILKPGKTYYLEPCHTLTAPFIALHGIGDKVCKYTDTQKYIASMHNAELVTLPKVGHGFAVEANWLPQFITAFNKINTIAKSNDKPDTSNTKSIAGHYSAAPNLPITLINKNIKNNLPLVFFISGDGGWSGFDQSLADKFAEKGMPGIGLDAQKYFWKEKTPDEAAKSISSTIEYYMKNWDRKSFILVGYSFGAGVIPFIANKLNPTIKADLKGVFCLSPSETADFEIHIIDMIGVKTTQKYKVFDEIKKIKELDPVCIYGKSESEGYQNKAIKAGIKVIEIAGGHHFGNNYTIISEKIMEAMLK